MNNKKEKMIYWMMGLGTGIVISGMVMMGIGLKLVVPVDEILDKSREENTAQPIVAVNQMPTITTSSDLNVTSEEEKEEENNLIEVMIPASYGSDEIAALLKEKGVLEDDQAFTEYISSKNKTKSLQHGKLFFPKKGQYSEILDILLRQSQ